jgi:hypothetical protein
VVKSRGLEKELAKVKASFQKESDEHDALRVAIGLVCDVLQMVSEQGSSSLVARTIQIMEQVREIMRNALHFSVHQSFAIGRSYYKNIDLVAMSQGFMLGYDVAKLEEIKKVVASWCRTWLGT